LIQDLYKLYSKNGYSDRIPLEDFNTEAFAGILKLYPEIKKEIIDFLGLPEDEYLVSTQVNYTLPDTQNCIIDLVFIGTDHVCFVENKVNSSEGWEQLSRYCQALDLHHQNHIPFLVYCTKFSDPKEIITHNFKQIRWFEIAKRLKKYSNINPTINDYLNFLKRHKMAQDNTFTTETIIAMENLVKTIEIIGHHVDLSEPIFKNVFKLVKVKKQDSVMSKDRYAYYTQNIFNDTSAYSELLYCIHYSTVKLQIQIWVDKKHKNISQLELLAQGKFKILKNDLGLLIFIDRPVYDLLYDTNSDEIIKQWFRKNFNEINDFMKATPELGWSIKSTNENVN
jgi:hypothetical protein